MLENRDYSENQSNLHFNDNYHKLKLNENQIKFIDNNKCLSECLNEILNSKHKNKTGHIFVGIDTEWKPSMVSGLNDLECKRASLIQISTHEKAYLIDMSILYNSLDLNDKQDFAKNFILNKNIIKIGYGFSEDIKKISHSFNVNDHDYDHFRQSVLDLEYLIGQVTLKNYFS
jgi:hypothetical protein